MSRDLGFLLILIALFSCKNDPEINPDISKIKINLKIERFEKKFYKASESGLTKLKNDFPFMFPKNIHDSIWIQKMTNETIGEGPRRMRRRGLPYSETYSTASPEQQHRFRERAIGSFQTVNVHAAR